MKTQRRKIYSKNESGFIIADFLFAFVMTIGVGIFIFALTFSLATIEVSQYIIWSTARHYSAANVNQATALDSAKEKLKALAEQFPLLTNSSGNSSWFELEIDGAIIADKLQKADSSFEISRFDAENDQRQPWTGVSSKLTLKLFRGLQIPMLGKVGYNREAFELPIRAFLIRNVSAEECTKFFAGENGGPRFNSGILTLEGGKLAKGTWGLAGETGTNRVIDGEDNGC
jgi:hypothetical protein